MILQAFECACRCFLPCTLTSPPLPADDLIDEKAQGIVLEEFFRTTAGKLLSPLGRALADDVIRRRAAAAAVGEGGSALAAKHLREIGDDLADLVAVHGADGFGA